jgi:hypothetical protein
MGDPILIRYVTLFQITVTFFQNCGTCLTILLPDEYTMSISDVTPLRHFSRKSDTRYVARANSMLLVATEGGLKNYILSKEERTCILYKDMPRGRYSSKTSGGNVWRRHWKTPCGRVYSGKQVTVDKLLMMHKKICKECQSTVFIQMSNIVTDNWLDNKSKILKQIQA